MFKGNLPSFISHLYDETVLNKSPISERHRNLLLMLEQTCLSHYGSRLVSIVIFGSIARGTYTPDSDLDILLIVKGLPRSRMERVEEFLAAIETPLAETLAQLAKQGYHTHLSPFFKTPEEAKIFSPLYLDMTQEVMILFDREGFFHARLSALKARLQELGSKRVWQGNRWYWILKPDLKPGEVFEI